MTKDEALKLALETLEHSVSTCFTPLAYKEVMCMRHHFVNETIATLKEALAQPEQDREEMKIKSVTMRCKDYDVALPIIYNDFGRVLVGQPCIPPQPKEPEQEPVAYIRVSKTGHVMACAKTGDFYRLPHNTLLYTIPPQRAWVGLTDDDKVLIKHDANFNQFMTAGEYADRVQQLTEARLKDKNK